MSSSASSGQAKVCKPRDNSVGFAIGVLTIVFYFIALFLNILNFIYLRYISQDRKRLPTYVSYYSLNMVCLKFGTIFIALDMIKDDYFMGNFICKYMFVSLELGNYMTTLLVMCICLDQYQFVFYSQTYNQRFTRPWVIALTLFSIAFSACVPFIFKFHVADLGCGKRICLVTPALWYSIVLYFKLGIFFIVPCLIMMSLYFRILYYLHARQIAINGGKPKLQKEDSFGDDLTDAQGTDINVNPRAGSVVSINFASENNSRKIGQYQRTIVHMMIIFGFFFITALPYFVLRGIYKKYKIPGIVVQISYAVWCIGHSFHPLLYTLANKHMKRDIIRRFKNMLNI